MTGQLNTTEATGLSTPDPSNVMGLRSMNRIDELYSPEYFGGLSQLAGAAAKSRLFGDLTQDQLFIVLMTGREMGLPPTVALRNIGSFKGKTVISSQLQMAKVKEAGYQVKILENSDDRATVSVGRKGEDPYVKTFTMADAVKAGLLRNELYKTNPSTMLLNRAIGLACRYGAPEVLNGLYNEAELIEIDDPGGHTSTARAEQPTTATISAASNSPTEWTIEEQEEFEATKDRMWSAFKTAGQDEEAFNKSISSWKSRKAEDPAEKVLTAFAAFVNKLEAAAAEKAAQGDQAA